MRKIKHKMRIFGNVENIIYRNDENGYTVLKIDSENTIITCVGKFPLLNVGQTIELEGVFSTGKYGRQFEVEEAKLSTPKSTDALIKYLASGLIPGIGEGLATRIVNEFKEATLEIIETSPILLSNVKGISETKAMFIAEKYNELKKLQNTMLFLQSYGLSTKMSLKIYKQYQAKTEELLLKNPYILIEDIEGIGFTTADKIAISIGINPDSEFRFRAGIFHILNENAESNGNTYIKKLTLFSDLIEMLRVDNNEHCNKITEKVIERLKIEGTLKELSKDGEQCLMLSKYYHIEKFIAEKLIKMQQLNIKNQIDAASSIEEFQRVNDITMNDEQKNAIKLATTNGACVITGGPGTGKTTITKALIYSLKEQGKTFLLLAPTGRASKRMSESTNTSAKTIHRALEINFRESSGMFSRNESNPLNYDAILVDEVSMVDCRLMHSLLKAIKPTSSLILIGDADQLPSVGPGNVLENIISSQTIPYIKLNKIYRQSENSLIISNAHKINNCEMPLLDNKSSDFFFDSKADQNQIAESIVKMVTERIPKFQKIAPLKIQVLAPMKSGIIGTNNLNEKLQYALNPPSVTKAEMRFPSVIFRTGDKVMQTVNNYEKSWIKLDEYSQEKGEGVFNGDIGIIQSINNNTQEASILFDDGKISIYNRSDMTELMLSYATTIHKSQGSEFDVIIMPISGGAPKILTKNLLYTGVTRAKKMVVLVGTSFALNRMVKNNYTNKRLTLLTDLLKESSEKIKFIFGGENEN